MRDAMLDELYMRAFASKQKLERFVTEPQQAGTEERVDRQRGIELAKNELLGELITIRTNQIRNSNNG